MRAARQQADELEQTNTFLHSLITTDGEAPKVQQPVKEPASQRQSNGRPRGPKMDHVARFAEPPAPPPQQPLPEKPDSAKASPVTTSFTNLLKRNDTAKQPNNASHSPTNTHNSQMFSLIEALSIAKKELDSQGAKVKELEDRLKQERIAREEAEERARKLEQHAAARPVSVVEEQSEPSADIEQSEIQTAETTTKTDVDGDAEERAIALQQNIDQMLGDMQRLRSDVDQFRRRAETAEADAAGARKSLADMIEKLRQENQETERSPRKPNKRHATSQEDEATTDTMEDELDSSNQPPIKWQSHANGHVRVPRLPEHLERAVATVLQEKNGNGDTLAQSAPYVSMLGVVLIGVGLMAYLNSWQKGER